MTPRPDGDPGMEERRPHVVMMVANDISTDTRVRKMAHDLAAVDLDVTLLAISPSGEREELALGAARVVRLPVGDLLSVRTGPRLGPSNRHELTRRIRTERERFLNHQRDVGAQIGWLRHDHTRARAERRADAEGQAKRAHRDERIRRFTEAVRKRLGRIPAGLVRRLLRPLLSTQRESAKTKRKGKAELRLRRRLSAAHDRHTRRQERLRARLVDTRPPGLGRIDWRTAIPELNDYEAAFGPELDRIEADVVHAQDIHLFGVAARGVARALLAGRNTKLIYDSHEYIQGLGTYPPRVVAAWSALEREYIQRADRIITVAPMIAELLTRDYQLSKPPEVVLNTPVVVNEGTASVRSAAGLGKDETLVIYSGGLDPTRGVETLVEAVGRLPGVHLGLIARVNHSYVRELGDLALRSGLEDRFHIVPFVQPQQVVSYLRSATIGVHPMISAPLNHRVTIGNKLFEYMHARLPIVISDCKAMADIVEAHEIGKVFVSEDVDSLTKALTEVLENLDKYHAAYERQPDLLERFSWRSERRKLFAVYRDLLGSDKVVSDLETEELAPLVPLDSP